MGKGFLYISSRGIMLNRFSEYFCIGLCIILALSLIQQLWIVVKTLFDKLSPKSGVFWMVLNEIRSFYSKSLKMKTFLTLSNGSNQKTDLLERDNFK